MRDVYIVREGKLLEAWRIDEKEDSFSFNLSVSEPTPYFSMGLSSSPEGGLDVENSHRAISTSVEEFTFRTKCYPMVSFRIRVLVPFPKPK